MDRILPFFDPLHCVQFLYPERGQKRTFFDPLPSHLVHVVTYLNCHSLFTFYFQENFQDSAANVELGRGKRNTAVIEQKLRQDHTAEEKRKSHQQELMEKMNEAALKRIKEGGTDKVETKVCKD